MNVMSNVYWYRDFINISITKQQHGVGCINFFFSMQFTHFLNRNIYSLKISCSVSHEKSFSQIVPVGPQMFPNRTYVKPGICWYDVPTHQIGDLLEKSKPWSVKIESHHSSPFNHTSPSLPFHQIRLVVVHRWTNFTFFFEFWVEKHFLIVLPLDQSKSPLICHQFNLFAQLQKVFLPPGSGFLRRNFPNFDDEFS